MQKYAHHATSAQASDTAIARARNALAIATDSPTRQCVIVQLVAEPATAGLYWSEIETISRDVAEPHGIDCDALVPRAHAALMAAAARRLAAGRCDCWACRGIS